MFGVRILTAMTAYAVVLLEVYSGAINGPEWWVLPGALVLTLLSAVSLAVPGGAGGSNEQQGVVAVAFQWILIVATAVATSYFANYFGREIVPDLIAGRVG